MKTKTGALDPGRLCEAMRRSRLSLRRFREERVEMVRQMVGSHWSDEGADKPVPINLIDLYVSVVGRNLIAKNPRVMLSTFDKPSQATVRAEQDWTNQRIEDMHLASTLQRIVTDALFAVGIGRVAIATLEDSARVGWRLDAGSPVVSRIDFDDFVFDVHARSFEEAGFLGHRYRVPLEVARFDKRFNRDRVNLRETPDDIFNQEGDERINVLGRSVYNSNYEEFEPYVDLWEVYVPRHQVVLTFAHDAVMGAEPGRGGEPLCAQRWVGPDEGPYHMLGLGNVVPGNAMPRSPIQGLFDLHLAVNQIYRKSIRQALRQKQLGLVDNMEEGERIKLGDDGELVRSSHADAVKVAEFGGVNAPNLQFGMHLKDIFGYMGGNLDMMGGLSPQSKTLGQDQMLAQNASRAVADMQDSVTNYVSKVLRSLVWFHHHHPTSVMKTEFVSGSIRVPRTVQPQERHQILFDDIRVRVDPYSLAHKTPESRLAALNQVMTQIVIPLAPVLQAQGIQSDLNKYLSIVANYLDEPDLLDIVSVGEPPPVAEAGGGGMPQAAAPGKPAETTRNYVRRSLGGDTPQARQGEMMNQLAAAGSPSANGQFHGGT